MDYQEILDYVGTLDFVPDRETADSMVKAVLGTLCSSVDEQQCTMLCDKLPEPLTVEKLRSHQARKNQPSFQEYILEIRTQFGLNDDQAFELVDAVIRVTRQAVGDDTWNRFTEHLPAELGQAIKKP